MKECILLLRVSTVKQDYDSQLEDLVKWSESKGFEKYYVINDKESGVKLSEEERNGLNEMKGLINSNQNIKSVFVWELSRLGRQQKVLFSVRDYLLERNVNLHIFDRKCDLIDESGNVTESANLLFSIYSYFAEQDAKTTKLRVARGKKYKSEQGKKTQGTLHFGYTTDSKKNIIVNEQEAELVKYVFNRYLTTDISARQLGIELFQRGLIKQKNEKSASHFILIMLQNFAYCGDTSYRKNQTLPFRYPQILPKELIEQAIEKLKNGRVCPRTTNNVYYCKGLLKNENGYSFQVDIASVIYFIKEPWQQINLNVLDSVIWALTKFIIYPIYLLNQTSEQIDELKNQIKVNNEKIQTQTSRIDQINNEMKRLKNLYVKGVIDDDEFDEIYSKQEKELKNINVMIESLKYSNIQLQEIIESQPSNKEVSINEIINLKDDIQRKKIIDKCINKIVVKDNKDIVVIPHIYREIKIQIKKIGRYNHEIYVDGKKENLEEIYEERFIKNKRKINILK